MDWNRHNKVLGALHWAVLLVLSAFSYFLMEPSFTLGVILGGLIVISNFNLMQHSISHAFSFRGATKKIKVFIILKFYLRLLVLGLILYTLIQWRWVDPVGLAVGLSTVLLSIVIFAICGASRTKNG